MGKKIDNAEALHQQWVHSYEEDTETNMVFRPATYELPPARGRVAFELRPDNTYVGTGIGPADVPEEEHGTWGITTVGGDDTVIRVSTPSGDSRDLKVVESEPDRLVISKE